MKLEKNLKRLLAFGVFLVPFIAIIVTGDLFFPFVAGKNFAFRLLVEIMLGAWLILVYLNKIYRPQKTGILISLTTFICIIAITNLLGANPYNSFFSNFERMEGFIGLAHLYVYFLITTTILNTEKLLERFFNVSLGVSIIVFINSFIEFLTVYGNGQDVIRIGGTFGNASFLATYVFFHIFIAVFLLFRSNRSTSMRIVYSVVAFLNLIVLYFTATRGAILGLVVGLFVTSALIAIFEKDRLVFRRGAIITIAGVLILLGIFFLSRDSSFMVNNNVLSRFTSISLEEYKNTPRIIMWGVALDGIKERPILGWGQENFDVVFNKYYDPRLSLQESWFDRVHNVFLEWFLSGGVFGLLGYISIFVIPLYLLWFKVNALSIISKSILIGMFTGYFFQNMFVFDSLMSYVMFFSMLVFIDFYVTKDLRKNVFKNKLKRTSYTITQYIAMSAIFMSVLFPVYFFNFLPYLENKTLHQAVNLQRKGKLENLRLFKKALAFNTYGRSGVRENLVLYAVDIINSETVPSVTKDKFFNLALDGIKKQIGLSIYNTRYNVLAGYLLSSYRMYDDALYYFKQAEAGSPNKKDIQTAMAKIYFKQGKYRESLSYYKSIYELESKFEKSVEYNYYIDKAFYNYIASLIYADKKETANKLLIEKYGTIIVPNDVIINAYARIKDYDMLSRLWSKRISLDGDDAQSMLSLSAVYLQQGKTEDSINLIKKMREVDSDFKQQGESLIQDIIDGKSFE